MTDDFYSFGRFGSSIINPLSRNEPAPKAIELETPLVLRHDDSEHSITDNAFLLSNLSDPFTAYHPEHSASSSDGDDPTQGELQLQQHLQDLQAASVEADQCIYQERLDAMYSETRLTVPNIEPYATTPPWRTGLSYDEVRSWVRTTMGALYHVKPRHTSDKSDKYLRWNPLPSNAKMIFEEIIETVKSLDDHSALPPPSLSMVVSTSKQWKVLDDTRHPHFLLDAGKDYTCREKSSPILANKIFLAKKQQTVSPSSTCPTSGPTSGGDFTTPLSEAITVQPTEPSHSSTTNDLIALVRKRQLASTISASRPAKQVKAPSADPRGALLLETDERSAAAKLLDNYMSVQCPDKRYGNLPNERNK